MESVVEPRRQTRVNRRRRGACLECKRRKTKCTSSLFRMSMNQPTLTDCVGDGGNPCSQCEVRWPTMVVTLPIAVILLTQHEYPSVQRYGETCKYNASVTSFSVKTNRSHGVEFDGEADLGLSLSDLQHLEQDLALHVPDMASSVSHFISQYVLSDDFIGPYDCARPHIRRSPARSTNTCTGWRSADRVIRHATVTAANIHFPRA